MAIEFKNSETCKNLCRAFAGESQARNRYTFAAGLAKQQKLQVVQAVFQFTADQEKEHAELFYKHLAAMSGEEIFIDGSYPIDPMQDMVQLLHAAQRNEYAEHGSVYPAFGDVAQQEGFADIAATFRGIAPIEQTHGNRFGHLAEALETGKLFVADAACGWMCLNCGHIFEGTQTPNTCPVCQHDQGFFIRVALAPYGGEWLR